MQKLRAIWNVKEIRNNVLYVLGMLVIFRLTAHIPIPGVNTDNLRQFLEGNQFFGLLNIFSGGTIQNFSIVMLGVAPYITASIIIQILTKVIPSLEEIQKEGEQGQRKISLYTRVITVPLAILQAFALTRVLSQTYLGIIESTTTFSLFTMISVITAGTLFLMWLGELINERKVGNGISLLIFAGIISGLPQILRNLAVNYSPTDLYTYALYLVLALLTIVAVVFISEGQRNIPIRYASQSAEGRQNTRVMQSHLPIRVNTAGVIPIIFAISVVLFPPLIAQFLLGKGGFVGSASQFVIDLFNNQLFYGALYFALVFGFTYFYTALVFLPEKVAENLQKQGAFIPGIRPGKQTEMYLATLMNRLVFVGALFLSTLAVLPVAMQALTGTQSLVFGGTSLLIVVSVAIDAAKQLDAQITTHQYDHI